MRKVRKKITENSAEKGADFLHSINGLFKENLPTIIMSTKKLNN